MNTPLVIQQTRAWVNAVVIDQEFCPFAKREYDRNSIHYCVIESALPEDCLTALITECQRLDSDPDCETVLLILTQGFIDFEDFLELIDIAETLLIEQGYEGIYQLASFHPDYCFADAPQDDPANYTNRSPYPMLHLLREASIEAVLKRYPDPESIPERNIQHTRQLGIATLRKLLADCFINDAPSQELDE
jgi:hypothetical protein